ncbi:MAG: hypothetical protein IJA02_09305 [Clostridia bacterium]|nr:hypothetical protein [Clostridia bacterium]
MAEKIEITKEMLEKILSEKSMEFTLEEIEELMNSEVEKPEDEMDTELVDMCAEILAKAYNPGFNAEKPAKMYRPWEAENKAENVTPAKPNKKRAVRFKYVALVAAILAVLGFIVALPAGAMLFDDQASGGIIEFYADFFHINLNKDKPSADDIPQNDAVSNMIINNLDNFMLPEVLRGEEYKKQGRLTQDDFMTTFYIDLVNATAGISGYIQIVQYNDISHAMTNGQVNVPDNTYNYFKEILIEGKQIIVFGKGEQSYINYSDGATNFEILLDCDFDTMVSIAETINVKG